MPSIGQSDNDQCEYASDLIPKQHFAAKKDRVAVCLSTVDLGERLTVEREVFSLW